MACLIVYTSKHGATAEIAKKIAEHLPGATLCNLKEGPPPPVTAFSCVIAGGPLYAGNVPKELTAFLTASLPGLSGKKLGIFLSGMDISKERSSRYFENNFSKEVLAAADATAVLGGIYNPKKVGFFEGLLYKIATKNGAYANNVQQDALAAFAATFA